MSRLVQLIVRRRRPLLAGLAATSAWLSSAEPADMRYFSGPGGRLLTGHLASVYSDPQNQGGPLQLIISRLSMAVSHQHGPLGFVFAMDPWAVAIINAGLVLLAMSVCRRAAGPDREARARREILVGSAVLFWLTPQGLWNGHPTELMIPLLWIAGLVLLRRERWLAAAVLFGLAVGVAPWAVLGFPCALAARRVVVGLRMAAGATVFACCEYLPFVLTGHFQMLHGYWYVSHASLIHVLFPDTATVNWGLRLGQASVVGLGCAYVAWRYRANPLIVTIAPLTVTILRIATDPVQLDYYWVPVGATVIALAAIIPSGELWTMLRLRVLVLLYLPWAALSLNHTLSIAVACLLLTVTLLTPANRSIGHRILRRIKPPPVPALALIPHADPG